MNYIKFCYYYSKWWLYGLLGRITVNFYIKLTPDKPIEDSLRAIILEQLLFFHRRQEVKRYNTWNKVTKYAAFLGVNEKQHLDSLKVDNLQTENDFEKP